MPAAFASSVGVNVSMLSYFADCKAVGKSNVCSSSKDRITPPWQTAKMPDEKNGGPNYLRAWREYRKMTQEELAAACKPPTTGSVISLLEEGERGLSLKWLRKLAPALKTRPGYIADLNPLHADTRTLELIENIPQDQREQVTRILETFARTGSDDAR